MSLVTVYLVCSNHEEYVRQAVDSVLAQTHSQIEFIAFDNGSTDRSRSILRELRDQHGFRLIEQENLGLVATIRAAFDMAQGEYVVRLDADDWLEPRAIAELLARFHADDSVAMVFPDYFEVAADGRILRRIRRRMFDGEVTLLDQPAHGAVTLTRKSAYFEVGGVDTSLTAQDGYDLWLKITRKYPVQNVPEAMFYYRRHDGNLTGDVTRILKQRYAIFRNQSSEIDPDDYLGVIVLPRSRASTEEFLNHKYGQESLLHRALKKLSRSEIIRSAVIICPQSMEGSVERLTKNSNLRTQVHSTEPGVNGYHFIARTILPTLSQIKNVLFVSPQNPFMHLNYVDAMIHYKSIFNVASVHTCVLDNHLMFQHNGRSLVVFNDGAERQERDAIIRKAGGLMLVDAAAFANLGHGLAEPIGHIEIDEISSFEISSPISVKAAEALANVW